MSPIEPQHQHRALERALKAGDLAAIRAVFAGVPGFPNVADPLTGSPLLQWALTVAPASLVYVLLDLGADPDFEAADGFPALYCAIERDGPERYDLIAALLAHGADPGQRGLNDYTPLHVAAERDDVHAIEILLAHGADRHARTRIDDHETPLDLAERRGHARAAAALRQE
ncbi:MAG: ankyrin repeat domain-containing protein [Vicinamibacterales bacterium]